MLFEKLLYVLFVGVGDGDVLVAEDDAETVDTLGLGHVDDIGAVGAQKFGTGQIVFKLFHVHKTHDLLPVSEIDAYIILESLNVQDVVKGYAYQLVVAFDEHEAAFMKSSYEMGFSR